MDEKQLLKGLEEICLKEENIKKILQAKTKDDIKELFAEKGIELTDERFKILKESYSKVVGELKKLSQEELNKISGGLDIKERTMIGGTIGCGDGVLWGLGVGVILGGSYAIADTIQKSKASDGFLKNVWKVIGKTSVAVISTAALGGTIGGIAGLASGASGGAYSEWDRLYGKKTSASPANGQ